MRFTKQFIDMLKDCCLMHVEEIDLNKVSQLYIGYIYRLVCSTLESKRSEAYLNTACSDHRYLIYEISMVQTRIAPPYYLKSDHLNAKGIFS